MYDVCWDLAVQLIGTLPAEWSFLYAIGTFIVFLCKIGIVMAPVLIVLFIVKGR